MPTAVASARYSRSRLTAACTARAATRRDQLEQPADDQPDHDDHEPQRQGRRPCPEVVAGPRVLGDLDDQAEEHVREQHDRADEQRDEHRVPRVEVGDVRQLVRDDALELLAVEPVRGGRA